MGIRERRIGGPRVRADQQRVRVSTFKVLDLSSFFKRQQNF